ncbi:MAG: hypothetical protein HYS05_14200 [Acidobacteria bacterium]|nr:hypothetical protein [Acidobacteriota bacterium]
MLDLKTSARMSLALGVLSLLAVLLSHLALTDIYHGEADPGLEWRILRACFVVIFMFQVFALVTLARVVRAAVG